MRKQSHTHSPRGSSYRSRFRGRVLVLGPRTRAASPSNGKRADRYRGRENPSNREEATPGSVRSDAARLAARHRSRKREAWRVRKGRRSPPSSLRGIESRGRSARTSWQLQKSASGTVFEYAPAQRSKKSRGGGERETSSRGRLRKEGRRGRKGACTSDAIVRTVADRLRLRMARDRHPAVSKGAESARRGRGTGIERSPDSTKSPCRWKAPRVSRASGFHESVVTVTLAASSSSETPARRRRDRDEKRERRQRCQRLDRS